MELSITKEKVLAAAANCETAKETLKILFPEAFEKEFGPMERFVVDHASESNPFKIFIGRGLAPEGWDGKCLMIEKDACTIENANRSGELFYVIKPIIK